MKTPKRLKGAPSISSLPISNKMEFIEVAVEREKVNKQALATCMYLARTAGGLTPKEVSDYYHIGNPESINITCKRYSDHLAKYPEQKNKINEMILEASEYFNGYKYSQVKPKPVKIVEQPVIQMVDLFSMGINEMG